MIKARVIWFFVIMILPFAGNLFAQEEWIVPEDKKGNVSPFVFTETTQKQGKKLYNTNCQSCHGQPGKENFIALNPLPGDLSWPRIQEQSDGEWYYKLTEGRGAMPSFKNILTPEQRWELVAYLRTYDIDYIQPSTEKAKAFTGAAIILTTEYIPESHVLKVVAKEKKEPDSPAEGLELAVFAKRYFGDLKLGEDKTTDRNGETSFELPQDLPGDTAGNLHCYVKVVNNDAFSNVIEEVIISTNNKADDYSLTEKRALWNSMRKIPVWLLASYLLVVAGVFGTLIYIALLVRKIYFSGKQNTN